MTRYRPVVPGKTNPAKPQPPKAWSMLLASVVMALLPVYWIYKGKYVFGEGVDATTVTRADDPVWFWTGPIFDWLMAAALAASVIFKVNVLGYLRRR